MKAYVICAREVWIGKSHGLFEGTLPAFTTEKTKEKCLNYVDLSPRFLIRSMDRRVSFLKVITTSSNAC